MNRFADYTQRLGIPSENQRTNDLAGTINATNANWICITPTVARLLDPNDVPTLDTLILVGEPVTQTVVDQWRDHVTHLYNGYGPTESTLYCAVNPELGRHGRASNVGRGLYTNLWVVDPDNFDRLAPLGCAGELLIEGPLLARGYLNDAQKTASSFILNPGFTKANGKLPDYPRRMYRTGDLVRYNDDGSLDVLGRIDSSMVKFYGQRLELGEIEHHLTSCEEVENAVAMVHVDEQSTKRIMAVVTLRRHVFAQTCTTGTLNLIVGKDLERLQPSLARLREHLKENVPQYMVPTLWTVVDSIPRNASDKVDRAKISAWSASLRSKVILSLMNVEKEGQSSVQTTPMAGHIRTIIAHVLNVPESDVLLNHSFLSLGGDSITAMQMVVRCRNEGIKLLVKDILQSRSITKLSELAQSLSNSKVLSPAHYEERLNQIFPLTPVQQMYFDSAGQKPNQLNQSFCLQMTKAVPISRLAAAVEAIVARHPMLRARYKKRLNGCWGQFITSDTTASFRFRVKQLFSEDEIAQAFLDCQDGIDVESGPLLGADILTMPDNSQLLILTIHHLVIDLVSWRIIFQEIEDYLTTGALSTEKPFPFQKWVELQSEYAREHLNPDGVLPFDIAPSDFAFWGMDEGKNNYSDVDCYHLTVDEATTSAILGNANEAFGTEPNDILIACALNSFKYIFNDRKAPTVWKESIGREPWDVNIDLSTVVGWFTNLAPLFVDVKKEGDLLDAVRRVKDVSRKLPNKGWPYFTSRYLNEQGRVEFQGHEQMELLFNYIGRFQQLERTDTLLQHRRIDTGVIEPSVGRDVPRLSLIEIQAVVMDEKFQFKIMFNRRMQHIDRIGQWIKVYSLSLQDAAVRLLAMEKEKTLSDFPLLSLNYDGLEKLKTEKLHQLGLSSLSEIEAVYPCVPMQEALLFGAITHNGAYDVDLVFEVTSSMPQENPVNVDRLLHAWQSVISHQPMLRTVFVEGTAEMGLYDQIVLKNFVGDTYQMVCDDEDCVAFLNTLDRIKHSSERPVHRLTICTTPTSRVFCKMEFVHAAVDAKSLSIILDDLRLAYEDRLQKDDPSQFSEYVKYLQSISLTRSIDFWANRLSGISPCHLPTMAEEGSPRELKSIQVDLSRTRRGIRNFLSKTGTTFPNLVQTAWGLVLRSYTGLDHVCFGYLVSGRDIDIPDADKIVGPLINNLVCNIDFSNISSVKELLQRNQDQNAAALEHQHVSIGQIQHALGISGRPIFNTAMSTLRPSSSLNQFKANSIQENKPYLFFDLAASYPPTEYDLSISLVADEDDPTLLLSYWTSGVSDWQANNISATFETVLNSIMASVSHSGKIADLEVFSGNDHRQVDIWNSTPVLPESSCIHHVFERRVNESPQAEALCWTTGSMSYAQLNRLATKLSYELIRRNVGPETIVPVCFEKSPWAVVSMLAILKAGGAFVPLDPSHPELRHRQILEDVDAKLIISSSQQAHLFSGLDYALLLVDEAAMCRLSEPQLDPGFDVNITPRNLAYVIFTSGTTGKPKGTMIEHEAYCTNSRDHSKVMGIDKSSRVLQFASYVFDASILEIFSTLMQGGSVCIPSDDERSDIASVMNRMRVSWALLTPSFANVIDPKSVPGLKTLVLGGEALSTKHINIWSPHVQLMNAYGPSESAVCGSINPRVQYAGDIGYAIGGFSWIADKDNHDKLAPVGAIGELLIEGPILGRGYLKQPDKTKTAFIHSSAIISLRGRVYKTGDLVRYKPDGSLMFLGRKDNQVKLRGQRLEIGEIEYYLQTCELVRNSVVVMPSTGPRSKSLVGVLTLEAFLSPTHNTEALKIIDERFQNVAKAQVDEISEYLVGKIPPYMVPTSWIVVGALPLNTSGKMDRERVSRWVENLGSDAYSDIAVGEDDPAVDTSTSQEVNTLQVHIQNVIGHVLNISPKRVALNKSFVGLGGDSITAMQVVTRARSGGIVISIGDMLQRKSIAQVAQASKHADLARKQYLEVFDQLFDLSPIQQMFVDLGGMPDKRFNQSFLLRVTRNVAFQEISTAMDKIILRHSMLRARFLKGADGKWRQYISQDTHSSYRIDSHNIPNKEQAVSIMESSQSNVTVQSGPLFSVNLFNVNNDDQLLYLVAHHLVIDLVSWRIILQDLEHFIDYGKLPDYTPLPFQSWTKLQTEYAATELHSDDTFPFRIPTADYTYWKMDSRLNTYGETESLSFSLDRSTSIVLLEQCHAALDTKPVELFLAALFHSFAIVFPDRELPAIYSEGHGRELWNPSVDPSSTIGWFTTMVPLQVLVSGNNVVDVIRRTKDVRRSIPRNGWDYFTSKYLAKEGKQKFGSSPFVEIAFNYVGQYQQFERSDSLLRRETLDLIPSDVDNSLQRVALFEISASVVHGVISIQFLYNRNTARKADIRRWADVCAHSLNTMAQILPNMLPEKTISDFPQLPLSYESLKNIQEKLLPKLGLDSFGDVEDMYPTAPMQQGLLLSQTRLREAYRTSFSFKVNATNRQTVDTQNLRHAWQEVVDRHAMLRTVFTDMASNNGMFGQLVLGKAKASIVLISGETDDEAASLLRDYPISNLDLLSPHRLLVCSSPSGKAFIRLDANHAILDAASLAVLLRDLSLAYEGRLPQLPRPLYSDYIKYLKSKPINISLQYWKKYLEGLIPCHIPVHNDDAPDHSELRSIELSLGDSYTLLQRFCEMHSVTAAAVFHAVWSIILGLYNASEDVCYGYLVSGRDIPVQSVEDCVGPFINMLVSRSGLSSNTILKDLVQQKQDDYAASIEHEACSLAEIQHAVGLTEQPLFNTMLSVQASSSFGTHETSALSFESSGTHDPTEYDIAVSVILADKDTRAIISYHSSKLSNWHAENISGTFSHIFRQILTNPSGKIEDICPLSERDQSQIVQWHRPNENGCPALIHELIAKQALRSPQSVAIDSFDGSFTYRDIDRLSTRFSHHLLGLGVITGSIVPYCFPKSAWAIIAMLSILKSGGCCMPLSPSHPRNRLRMMIEDSKSNIVIIAPGQVKLVQGLGAELVLLSPEQITKMTKANAISLSNKASSDSDAVIIYTSGSTGTPKGVIQTHHGICTAILGTAAILDYKDNSRVFQFAAYTFDASIADIFGALFSGSTLCVISEEERIGDLTHVINAKQATHIGLTPTVARTLSPEKLSSLKILALGGEPMSERDLEMWRGYVELINLYGPTEATVNTTTFNFSNDGHMYTNPRNIGRSFASNVWVADPIDIQKPIPLGAVGELVISGPTLARGYLNDVEKTIQSFVDAPEWIRKISSLEGSKVYKTGDLVRYMPNGTLNFERRRDGQIKIRGQRVETGEIEHLIKSHLPGLKDISVALTNPRHRGTDPVLTAFMYMDNDKPQFTTNGLYLSPLIVSTPTTEPMDPIEKKGYISQSDIVQISESVKEALLQLEIKLADTLPAYMIPSMYVPLRKIPMTVSGKIDIRRLKSLVADLSDVQLTQLSLTDSQKRPPSTRMEKKLHRIWSQVLSIPPEHIGIDDSFFRLGDSLSAIRLVSQGHENGIHLSVAEIFQHAKLSEMASVVDASSSTSVYEELQKQFAISRDDVQDFYPATPFQEGVMILSMKEPGAYRQRKMWTLPENINLQRLRIAFQAVFNRHPILRTTIVALESTGSLQIVMHGDCQVSEVSSISQYLDEERDMPMTYGQIMIKWSLIRHENTAPQLALSIHHAIYDEWSMGLILDQVESTYLSLQGHENEHPHFSLPLFSSFVDYISQVNEKGAQAYWKSQLSGAQPADFPRLPTAVYQPTETSVFRHSLQLPFCKVSNSTQVTKLLAAWALVVATYSRSNDVTFGLASLGRDIPIEGILEIVGPTIATVPCRINIDYDLSIMQFLHRVQSQRETMRQFEHFGMQNINGCAPENLCNFQHLIMIHDQHSIRRYDTFWKEEETGPTILKNRPLYPLMLECYTNNDTLDLVAQFDESIVNLNYLKRIIATFEHILDQLVTSSSTKTLSGLALISSQDHQKIMQLNHTIPSSIDMRIDELIDVQILERPDAVAVETLDGNILTYKQLHEHASRLAHHLQNLGVGPEILVPLCFDKSIWAIIAMVAVIYSGGAFVPMDATHPVERLREIVQQTDANLVLASPERTSLCESIAQRVLTVSAETTMELPGSAAPLLNSATSRNTAYILFTSGSTGKPKGVVMEHRHFSTGALEQGRVMNLNPETRMLHHSSYAFDVFTMEVLFTLLYGGCICVVSQEQRLNDVVGAINQLQVNFAFFTPSFVRTFKPEQVPCIKTLMLGGEALGADNVETWGNKVLLMNGYGPCETCVSSVIHDHVKTEDRPDMIGRAVNGACWVVAADNHNRLVPLGAVGELLIEGPTLARGYLNDLEKSQRSFIEDPEWLTEAAVGRPAQRLYKTGDLAIQYADGTLSYVGRTDWQVKIRGRWIVLLYSNV
jgi:amino acid adenylation domain-containing protein/non-ribosomal peptide synthase protein (TIGR01720 family)